MKQRSLARASFVVSLLPLLFPFNSLLANSLVVSEHPRVSPLLKPAVLKKIVTDREIMAHASLQGQEYDFYVSTLVRAGVKKTFAILTDYQLYAKIIHYIEKSAYNPKTHLLDLAVKLWKFRLSSVVSFEEMSLDRVKYQIIGGHLLGLKGEILLEEKGEAGTLVYVKGVRRGTEFPPKLVIEEGAKVVLRYAGHSMRKYIENFKGDVSVEKVRAHENKEVQNERQEADQNRH